MSDRLIQILLIDDDPIFRLGLRTALEPFSDLQVVAEADTGAAALETLTALHSQGIVDLVVLELALGQAIPNQPLMDRRVEPGNVETLKSKNPFANQPTRQPTQIPLGLHLCQQLKTQYPNLPILLITAQSEPALLAAAQATGVDGYCPKGVAIALIIEAMRQVVAGESAWQMLPAPTSRVRPPSWHHKLRSYGLRQIEDTLAQVTQQLQNPHLSNLDWVFWSGRRRELLAARWVVNQLLPTDIIVVERESRRVGEWQSRRVADGEFSNDIPTSGSPLVPTSSSLSRPLNPGLRPATLTPPHLSTLYEVTLAKLQSSLSNLTGVVLEIDILQAEKRQDLLQIILQKFQDILDELRVAELTLDQIPQKRSLILHDLWQVSVTEFFGKYYTLPVGNQEFEVVNVLLSNVVFVQNTILNKIPFVVELLACQLFEIPLMIDNIAYSARTPEALERAEMLLQNLIIQVANAVIQPLLNEFADVETLKQDFYDRRLISSREIARFRNNLSWKYRLSQLLSEPRSIFESRYDLFVLSDTGIKQTSIYAPRRQELEQLQGIQLAVTLAYEARDAIAPRLRGVVAWAGKGAVYVLTQVLGRAIGLVVRGVLQGIGNTLQDTRFGKTGERGK